MFRIYAHATTGPNMALERLISMTAHALEDTQTFYMNQYLTEEKDQTQHQDRRAQKHFADL